MSFFTLFVVGIITAAEFFYILHSLNERMFLTALGYKAIIDLIFGFGITVYFALSGTISGLIIASITGLMFTITLFVTEKLFGSRKKVNGKWYRFLPSWDKAFIVNKFNEVKGYVSYS